MNRHGTLVAATTAALGACLLAGCPTTATSTTYIPITGVVIRAATLTEGHGCGLEPGQVYKYAALLSYAPDGGSPGAVLYSGVFDCFADGTFSNLPENASLTSAFALTVLAWNAASFPAALQCDATDAAFIQCPGDDIGTLLSNEGTPNWSTTCTATQQLGVTALAVCGPLEPPGSARQDGGAADAADAAAATDAAGEADTSSASDATGDAAGATDAPAAADAGDAADAADAAGEAAE